MIIKTKRASCYEEIKPLVLLCKHGRLFDVQNWIDEDKPIDPPIREPKKARKKGPLEISIETGFHSLVQILLQAGASIVDGHYNALEHALRKRRLDLIDLLVSFGANIHSIDVRYVFEAWDPLIMKYFLDRGIDAETGEPLAGALIDRIRTALGVYKQYSDKYVSFPEQLNVALRWHAKEGNEKWVSLLLWAGGDPNKPGSYGGYEEDEEFQQTAIELAMSYNHLHLFNLKNFQIDINSSRIQNVVMQIIWNAQSEKLLDLIDLGLDLAEIDSDDFSMIQCVINGIYSKTNFLHYFYYSSDQLERLKIIHILARAGIKWSPQQQWQFKSARKSFLSTDPKVLLEFIWIMRTYRACSQDDIIELIKTTNIKRHILKYENRINELVRHSLF